MRHALAALFVLAATAGCFGDDEAPALVEEPSAPAMDGPDAVVAFIDTGINPYHTTFRDGSPRSWQHPSTYLPDYPADAVALNLTFDADDWEAAVAADCEDAWSTIEPGVLYWFPGTKVVGAVYVTGEAGADCSADTLHVNGILDYGGHGTMVASRGASVEYGACQQCLVVSVQGFNVDSVLWASTQPWIDAQSNSWGPFLPVPGPDDESGLAGNYADTPTFARAVEEAAQAQLAFWATGNGAATRFGVLGHPTIVDPRMTPSIVMVGGHDSGFVNTWPDFPPHVVSDSCNSWAAHSDSLDDSEDDVGGGTSGATPYAAGGAARLLLEARTILGDVRTGVHAGIVASGDPGAITEGPLADGEFTLAEWKELLFKTASERPVRQHEDGSVCDAMSAPYHSTPVAWSDVPDDYPEYTQIGYGAVDNESREVASTVLRGAAALPDRSETDAYFAMDAEARQAFYDTYQGP